MADDVQFGLWYDFRNPRQWRVPFESFYRSILDQIVAAEELGIDSVWLTEHHFCDDGYTPSPLVLGAAIAERTTRLRIGTNLMLLPLHDPIRLAEDSATLSLLSGGRFDLGVGMGYRQVEFDAFGRSLTNRPSLLEEGVEVIRRAWSGEPIDFVGPPLLLRRRRRASRSRTTSRACWWEAWPTRRSSAWPASPTASCRPRTPTRPRTSTPSAAIAATSPRRRSTPASG